MTTPRNPEPPTPSEPATDNNASWDEDEKNWRHPPVAPKDENPLDSFGRSVSEAVTGTTDERPGKPKTTPPPKS